MNWSEFDELLDADDVTSLDNAFGEVWEASVSELQDTGSVTICIGEREFLVTLVVEEVGNEGKN